jgi:hypothetical protein
MAGVVPSLSYASPMTNMPGPFAGIDRDGSTRWVDGPMPSKLTEARARELAKPRPWRPSGPIPVSSQTLADLRQIMGFTPPLKPQAGDTVEERDGWVTLRRANGNVVATIDRAGYDAICERMAGESRA